MISLMTERINSTVHIRYFNIGVGKALTYCRRSMRTSYANSYGVSNTYGVTCPKCLSAYTQYQDNSFRTFRSLTQLKMASAFLYPLGAEDRYDLDGEYWYKFNRMKYKLSKISKYHDATKTKVHKSKKISVNKKR